MNDTMEQTALLTRQTSALARLIQLDPQLVLRSSEPRVHAEFTEARQGRICVEDVF